MIKISRYTDSDVNLWNSFNMRSKNPLFMFDRNYMDYHRDRFYDHSLMFFEDDELIALLPACEKDGTLASHAGLTFGGFIIGDKMKQHIMNDCFSSLKIYAHEQGLNAVVYKTIPHIYHLQPSEEDWYALYSNNGHLDTVDVSTVINLSDPLKMPKGRKAQISRAKREGVVVEVLTDLKSYEEFITIENDVLESKHDTHAVHTAEELKMLHDRFPQGINLYAATLGGKIIAGVVIYEYSRVIHTQYMAANDEARKIGGLDLAVSTIIERYKNRKQWLDFGISTEHGRIYLNEGLAAQKEGFGGRTIVYNTWRLPLDSNC